ncbi:MAG: 50S ribosomal protein L11 methyltransferase [Desulfosalsimonadaceae bacterium]
MRSGKKHSAVLPQDSAIPPYPRLYIYYLSGRVPARAERSLGPSFIGNWQEEDTSFLFFSEPADVRMASLTAAFPGLRVKDRFEMSYEDWQGGPVPAFQEGRFHVMPPWAAEPAEPDKICIMLDPGVVFGAGNHPTTRHCLHAVQWLMSRQQVETVLDLGTGTGLLALAAARMGAGSVLAVDNNFLAAATALANTRRNGLGDRVFTVCARAEDFIDHPAELLVANIHYDVMGKLVANPGFRRKRWAVLSGLMRSQAGRIKAELAACGAEVLDELIQDGVWHTICAKLRPAR